MVLRRLWSRTEAPTELASTPDCSARAVETPTTGPDLVRAAYAMILWRAPSDSDVRDVARALDAGQSADDFFNRLLVSSEFRILSMAVCDDADTGRPLQETEAGLMRIGDDVRFIELAFQMLLGRHVDPSGRASYLAHLGAGHPRLSVLRALIRSDEFKERYTRLCPQAGFIPRDVQLCELANPAKWANPDWLDLLRSLAVVPVDRPSMHRKAYEFTQLLFGLTRLGFVRDDVRVLSVGAGHEPVLYWLANRVGHVIATDMYGGVWQAEGAQEGDATVLSDASQFAPFPYRADRLVFLKMDGRFLAFADETFDVVYSLSSIEHFGGFAGARDSVVEMARVLKPGGLLALATEYSLSGPPHHEAFQPADVRALLTHPALSLVQPIDEGVWGRYEYKAIDLRVNPYQTPHMVVTDAGTVFTSVMAFLRKHDHGG
jgi:SAM-dependent methyltransferase